MATFRLTRRRPAGGEPGESDEWAVEREAEEALTSALEESDTATEVLHDSAADVARPGMRRLALGTIGLVLAFSGLLASKRRRGRGGEGAFGGRTTRRSRGKGK